MATQAQLRRQARLLARVKFGGELGALAQLLGEAKAARTLSIHNARAGAGALSATLEGLRPKISSAYDAADAQRAQGGQEASAGLEGLSGPVIDAIRASRARESAAQTAASAGDRAAALTDVGNRQVGARAGAIAETRAAEQTYRTDSKKIFDQLLNLQSRTGDFLESTTMDLSQKQRDYAIRKGNLDVSRKRLEEMAGYHEAQLQAGAETRAETKAHHRAMEKKGGGKSGGTRPLTRGQQNDFVDKVDTASSFAQQLKAAGLNGHEVRKALLTGVDKTTSSGAKVKIPSFPKQVVNTAMDLAYLKKIGPENKRRVKARGVKIPSYWK